MRDTPPTIPELYARLVRAVSDRGGSGRNRGFGSALPISAAVHDLLHSSDHHGRLGMVPGLADLERITRLALGDSHPSYANEQIAVSSAVFYLDVQAERLTEGAAWTAKATAAVEDLADRTVSRIDVERVRLDWENLRKRLQKRIVEIDGSIPTDDTERDAQAAERAHCIEDLKVDYIDFEGFAFDAILNRFNASASPFTWMAFVTDELSHMTGAAMSILGLADHSQRRLVACPMCGKGQIGLTADPDIASCDWCGKSWTLSNGFADAFFGAFRDAGWQPRHAEAS